ncbi:RING finger protein, putative [Pediculus humanus corporis]|uniref:RING finger protein, putative n=1 Tax=Pediculus humanus subsp. corporis TaxID=121224 RepID=E0VMU9_PEDHC|nr:RING finger protein, putative [Pediculus humanus corporis]EEB14705.1 RING finger protein, putative [Pediculus humanus corporis]
MDEVIVKHEENGTVTIETDVFPATASDHSSQYVRVTLIVTLPVGYPNISPTVDLKNSRGLDDSVLDVIKEELDLKIKNLVGDVVVFELIEVVREHLTESNLPSCHCVICLYGFSEEDQFVKTQCYHYFHSYCLACHIKSSERIFKEEQEKLPAWQRTTQFQQRCAVCREVISVDIDNLSKAAPPTERENARNFELDENLLALQKKMAALFKHQQSRGGIIDVEAEETKLLLVTSPVSESSETTPGPSVTQNSDSVIGGHNNARREFYRGGRGGGGFRGGFAASRKSRGHFYSASR